jgi:DNA polymerase-3 subunit delta'
MSIYPWQVEAWKRVRASIAANRLPHGLLFTGAPGCGQEEFANQLAAALLCQSVDGNGEACGRCRACELFAAGTHSDFFSIAPAEDSSFIKIEQIRELIGRLTLTAAQVVGRRVAVIAPADAMNRHAANSLLKTLEEPPLNTTLILVSHVPANLTATVRSRCQQLDMNGEVAAKVEWLQPKLGGEVPAEVALRLAGGPLLAVSMHVQGLFAARKQMLAELGALEARDAEPIVVAARWTTLSWDAALRILNSLLHDLALALSRGTAGNIRNADLSPALRKASERLDLIKVLQAQQLLQQQWRLLASGSTVRAQDLLEEFAINWAKGAKI